jgi:DNA-binding response OmpR family regulator
VSDASIDRRDDATGAPGSAALDRRPRVLVVQGEPAIRDLLRVQLTRASFNVEETGQGTRALERIQRERFDLIVLDRALTDVDGITLCRAIRTHGHNTATPIVMLLEEGGASDRALGLESGADDCLSRSVDARELLARVRAIFRRAYAMDESAARTRRVDAHGLVLDPAQRHANVRGAAVELTGQEFDLLYALASRPGVVFSRAGLVSRAWPDDRQVTGRTVDTMVSRLRRKLERDAANPELILTAWGVGYKFAGV